MPTYILHYHPSRADELAGSLKTLLTRARHERGGGDAQRPGVPICNAAGLRTNLAPKFDAWSGDCCPVFAAVMRMVVTEVAH